MDEFMENRTVRELPYGLIRWYDFLPGSSKLLVYTDEKNKDHEEMQIKRKRLVKNGTDKGDYEMNQKSEEYVMNQYGKN